MLREVFPRLYSAEMMYERFEWNKKTLFHVFVIAERTWDRDYEKGIISRMLADGACSFCFYGELCDDWEIVANELVAGKDIPVKICDYEADFAQYMYDCYFTAGEQVHDIVFIYDDEVEYNWIIQKVMWLMQKEKLFHVVRMCLDEINPYGLLPEAPADEFYGEAEKIVDKICPEDTVEVIAGKMAGVLCQAFDLTFTSDMCMKYASRIVDSMKESKGE